MSLFIDPISQLKIGDPTHLPKLMTECPSHAEVLTALDACILSASGWRSVFVASGNEEDPATEITPSGIILVGAMAYVFADGLATLSGKGHAQCMLALACDTRPTGDLIADVMLRVFIARGLQVQHLFIAAAPEIMAYTRNSPLLDGFAYISASHNPIGHNGVKFGLKTGGVLSGDQITPLIQNLRSLLADPSSINQLYQMIRGVDRSQMETVFQQAPQFKRQALKAYAEFSDEVIADRTDLSEQQQIKAILTAGLSTHPIGVVADFNGSARTLTIDREYLGKLGVKLLAINDKPRQIAHRIVPEGYSLNQCRDALELAHAQDPAFVLGFVPDNDGDRGNFVYIDERTGKAHILEAQVVFALCCLAELADLFASGKVQYNASGKAMEKLAIAVNDPTSMCIDEIAHTFGVEVFRAEVGEANVVNLANELRNQGYRVRILGEGSNGGNITHPAAVRDPLNSIASLLKLLTMRDVANGKSLFGIWCKRSGQKYQENFGMADIIASLPAYTTTSAYEERAILHINSAEHAKLKASYEAVFLSEWEQKKPELAKRLGVYSWEELNNEGTKELRGFGPKFRSGKERGGFKILFRDIQNSPIAYLWMRGSGTEPVFRVSVDLKGNDAETEAWLLDWHVRMIRQADKA